MKKLLITTDCFLPRWDGVARFLSELLPSLKNHFDITVIAPKFSGKFQKIPGIKIIRMPLMKIRFGDIYFSRLNFKEVRKHAEKADIIFNQTIGPIGIAAIMAADKLKKQIISYVHSIEWELSAKAVKHFKSITELAVKLIARRLYNKCNLLLLPSKIVEDILTENKITTKKEDSIFFKF
ncbi:MAG: glycosyltransferase family 4 protein [Candidatus Woesearchaeota archaeon]